MTNTVRRREDLNTQIKLSSESISEWIQSELLKASRAEAVAVEKSVSFWKKQNLDFLPILTSLLVIRILKLNSWAAILICLLAIATTRKVISPTAKSRPVAKNSSRTNSVACIVHSIPGRVRFHVPLVAIDSQYTQKLKTLLKADCQVTNFRINRDAASVIVDYKPSIMPEPQMRSHGSAAVPSLSHLLSLIQSARDTRVTTNRTTPSIVLACSIEIRQATVSSDSCCLFKSKTGKPLYGGALGARSHRLYRLGMLT
jgi:hypothetical protein